MPTTCGRSRLPKEGRPTARDIFVTCRAFLSPSEVESFEGMRKGSRRVKAHERVCQSRTVCHSHRSECIKLIQSIQRRILATLKTKEKFTECNKFTKNENEKENSPNGRVRFNLVSHGILQSNGWAACVEQKSNIIAFREGYCTSDNVSSLRVMAEQEQN